MTALEPCHQGLKPEVWQDHMLPVQGHYQPEMETGTSTRDREVSTQTLSLDDTSMAWVQPPSQWTSLDTFLTRQIWATSISMPGEPVGRPEWLTGLTG